MAISRMQQPRQMYNQGMMVHDPRQAYGLGGFIKKAVRGVKKIAKSPIGKMALLYAGGTMLGGSAMMGGGGGSFMSRLASPGNLMNLVRNTNNTGIGQIFGGDGKFSKVGNMFRQSIKGEDGKYSTEGNPFSLGKLGLGALAGASIALPFMGGKGDDEESGSDPMDPAAVTQRAKNYYSGQGNAGVGLDFMPKKKYVSQNFYAADGGRAGYANGQLVTPSGDGSRPGYAGDRFLLPDNKLPKDKFGFMYETGPITDRNLEILNNMTEEERRLFEERGSPFDIIENFIKTPFIIRGGDTDYKADGGRAGYAMGGSLDEDEEDFIRSGAGMSRRQPTAFLNMGGGAGEAQAEQMLMAEFVKYKNKGGDLSFQQFVQAVMQQQEQSQGMQQPTMMAANGGLAGMTSVPGYGTPAGTNQFGYPSGGVRVGKAEGGIMETEEASEMIDMGGQEKDYRDEGGFVAMGGEERADDVPARLSKNEFVFTADAVRNAGGGDIDRGSEVMQNLMDNLEQGGQVSEDSQGLGGGEEMMSEEIIQEPDGAQAMYEQQQALQSRMA